jgi:hypothetical protein
VATLISLIASPLNRCMSSAAAACTIGDLVRAHVELVPIALEPSQGRSHALTTTVRMMYESFVDAVGSVLAHTVMVWVAAGQALCAFPFTLTACAPWMQCVHMFCVAQVRLK